jgi:hypothetical protein
VRGNTWSTRASRVRECGDDGGQAGVRASEGSWVDGNEEVANFSHRDLRLINLVVGLDGRNEEGEVQTGDANDLPPNV